MFKAGLAYQKEAMVNWDPVDCTVLANEQVDDSGRAERSGALVEQKSLKQWFFRITDYAEDLHSTLPSLDWPANVKQLQTKWIGRSEGFELDVDFVTEESQTSLVKLSVRTDSPYSALNASFLAIGYDHPLVTGGYIPPNRASEVRSWIDSSVSNPAFDGSISGTFTGLWAINPITSAKIPVFIADYISSDRGPDEADFGVPSCDQRARALADFMSSTCPILDLERMASDEEVARFTQQAEEQNVGRKKTFPVPVPHEQLPVLLRDPVTAYKKGRFREAEVCKCPSCGREDAHRETDTMDTFVDSAWYWLRYCDPKNSTEYVEITPFGVLLQCLALISALSHSRIVDRETASSLLPVDLYIGGVEHSIKHLFYARFLGKVLTDQGIVDLPNGEPFKKLLTQGMVQARSYREPDTGRYLKKDEIDRSDPNHPKIIKTGVEAVASWEKMSKSKFNGVDPLEIIERHGVDATRLYILFKAAPQDELPWDDRAVVGMERWLARTHKLVVEHVERGQNVVMAKGDGEERELRFMLHSTIQEVTTAMTSTFGFHVAISALMKLTNHMMDVSPHILSTPTYAESITTVVQLLAPFSPCVAAEMWEVLGRGGSVFTAPWPEASAEALVRDEMVCAIMVNGKTRGTVNIPVTRGKDAAEVERLARESEVGKEWLVDHDTGESLKAKRVIVAREGRMISFVLEGAGKSKL
ncbi:hypothetical protein HK104_005531 [Borealophlyctis nickersoniae]|nr:hypothetical protein HK104_005531 [Borealophlyctis nickersoniae]